MTDSISKQQCRYLHDKTFRGRKLIPLSKQIYHKFFKGADEHSYYTREEFGDGSCFFHSLATLLNMHHDTSNPGQPKQTQHHVLQNIKQLLNIRCRSMDPSSCFDFVRNDYGNASEEERKILGHKLRKIVLRAVDTHWSEFWSEKTRSQPDLLNRVYSKGQIKKMLSDTSVWADVYIIMFVMKVLDLNILFFDDNRNSIYCGVHGDNMKTQPTVFVLWVNNSHFQPILRLTCDSGGQHHIKGLFHHKHDNIVRHVFNRWENQEKCSTVPLRDVLL